MLSGNRWRWTWLGVASAVMVACAGGNLNPYPHVAWVPEGEERAVVSAVALTEGEARRVYYADSWQREEYVSYRAPAARGEFVYSTVNQFADVAIEHALTLERAIQSWNFNRKHPRQMGRMWQVTGPLSTTFYQPYTLTDLGWSCVASLSEWNLVPNDPYLRKGNLLFGYICDQSGRQLTPEEVQALVFSIGVRGVTEPIPPSQTLAMAGRDRAAAPNMAGAEAFARGENNPDGGAPGFPFKFARHFVSADGEGRDH